MLLRPYELLHSETPANANVRQKDSSGETNALRRQIKNQAKYKQSPLTTSVDGRQETPKEILYSLDSFSNKTVSFCMCFVNATITLSNFCSVS